MKKHLLFLVALMLCNISVHADDIKNDKGDGLVYQLIVTSDSTNTSV